MNVDALDRALMAWVNSFARRSPTFDLVVSFVDTSELLKGGILMSMVWGAWFWNHGERDSRRRAVLAAMLAGFGAVLIGRMISNFFAFRLRPLHDPSMHFVMPFGGKGYELKLWSSFPSQHTLFYAAVATGLLRVSRLLGVVALTYVTIFIGFPRFYLGYHYASDILCGILIGALVAVFVGTPAVRDFVTPPLMRLHDRRPGAFYAVFFLLSLQLSTMFRTAIALLRLVVNGPSPS